MKDFQDLLNRFRKGQFNYERMGDISEVRKRTNTILNDPRQMFLNTDANYGNMGSYVPSMPTPQEPQQPDFRVPSQMPGAMGGGFDHGITRNMSDIQQMPYGYGDQGGIQQMPYTGGGGNLQQMIKQKIPAMTLDGGKTYFDPRDGSPIDFNNLSLKDFLITP